MKGYHYILCWLMTLFAGMMTAGVMEGEMNFGLLFAAVSAVLSAPFIVIFSIVMTSFLRKGPTKGQLHAVTFGVHFVGSLMTFAVIMIFNGMAAYALLVIMACYFAFDSILFHIMIELKGVKSQTPTNDPELLDDSLSE